MGSSGSGTGFIVFLIVALFVGFWVYAIAMGRIAKLSQVTNVTAPPETVTLTVNRSLGKALWKRVDGPGQINVQRRGISGIGGLGQPKPTLSIDVVGTDKGSSVQLWMSDWSQRYGITAGCDVIHFARRKITRKLAELRP